MFFALLLLLISSSSFAEDPMLDVSKDCVQYRRLDQSYTLSNGQKTFGSMERVGAVNEDFGICFAVTASYLVDAWLQSYSPSAVQSDFRTSPIDLALVYAQSLNESLKREQAVNGSGPSAGFSFLGGNHYYAMEEALKSGVCDREKVVTEEESFDAGLRNWLIRTVGFLYEENKTNSVTAIEKVLARNSSIDPTLLPGKAVLEFAVRSDDPNLFYRASLSSHCLLNQQRRKIPFAQQVKILDTMNGSKSISEDLYRLLSKDEKGVQPVALSFCAAIMLSNDHYDIKNDPELKACRNHSSAVIGYCEKKDGKKSFLVREMAGSDSFPVYYRNERKSGVYPKGYYDDGTEPSGNYWVDEDVLNRTAKSISWLSI